MRNCVLAIGSAILFTLSTPAQATSLQDLHRLDRTIAASIDGWPVDEGLDPQAQTLSDVLHAGIADMIGQWPSLRKNERRSFAALMVSVALREAFGNRPFATERYTEWNRNACRTDLALDRFPVRLSNAIAQKQDHEILLSLIEFQNGLNCLSARQTRDFAWAFGKALLRTEHRLDLSEGERAAFFNLALLTVDQAKFAGMSPLHRWLQAHGPALHDRMVAAKDTLYLYDYMTGYLVGVSGVPLRAFGLEQVLDPGNIGMGSCSFLEMEGNSLNGGSHACARNMGCESSEGSGGTPFDRLGRGTATDGTLIKNRDLQRENQLEFNGRDFSNLQLITGPRTPFGTPVEELRPKACGNGLGDGLGGLGTAGFGAGRGEDRTGVGLTAFGNASWVGCVAATTIANRNQGDWATCQMNVAWNAANGAYGESYRSGGGVRAFGASGHESCRDPLAQDTGGGASDPASKDNTYNPYDGDSSDDDQVLDEAKKNTADFMRTEDGKKGLRRAANYALDKWAESFRNNPNLSEDGIARREAAYKRAKIKLNQTDVYTDSAARSVEKAKGVRDLGAVQGDTQVHNTDADGDAKMRVDQGNHKSQAGLEGTLYHEGMHAATAAVAADLGNATYKDELLAIDDHPIIEAQERTGGPVGDWMRPRFEQGSQEYPWQLTCGAAPWTCDTEGGTGPGGNAQLPTGPALCGAQQAMMRDMMSCTSPGLAGGGATGGTDPVASGGRMSDAAAADPGRVLPTLEQWTNAQANVFSQCMAAFGIGTAGVDENGFVIAGVNDPSNSTGCGTMICPPGGSAANVGGGCACSGRNGELGRPYTNDDLCFASDACLPGKPEVFIVVTQPELDAPTLNAPGQPTILNLQNRSLEVIDGKLRLTPGLQTRGISRP